MAARVSRIVGAGCALLFIGCAMSAVGPSYQEAKPSAVRQDAALVFVVRDYAEPTAIGADLTVDKAPVVQLYQKGFTWFYLKPGNHQLKAGWGLTGQRSSTIDLEAEAGQTYYVELVGVSRMVGTTGAGGFITRLGSGLNGVAEEYALKKLAVCKFQRPKAEEY